MEQKKFHNGVFIVGLLIGSMGAGRGGVIRQWPGGGGVGGAPVGGAP
jgi:hypothetical protein